MARLFRARRVSVTAGALAVAVGGSYMTLRDTSVSASDRGGGTALEALRRRITDPAAVVPSRASQESSLSAATSGNPLDILVIGGGATGCGVALDAATRGLRVGLVEREDFSSGTSSRSTKLIHGGVRYLEKAVFNLDYGQLKLVFHALLERKQVIDNAPHLCHALPCMTPCFGWFETVYYWVGLKMYDLVAGRHLLHLSRYYSAQESSELFPTLARKGNDRSLKGTVVYYDGQMNDSRVNVGLACTAALAGAAVLNHAEVVVGRSLLSQFVNISSTCPRFMSYSTSSKLQRRLHLTQENHIPIVGGVSSQRCYCSVATPEPVISETSSTSIKKRIVSGVQPTGSIHLGNYLGAIKNWVSLQDKYETLFFIVDLHAITLPYDVQQLSKATKETAALYLACGVDTSKASVFVQSHVRAHVELMWLLSAATPIGWLNRMIQFKEKSRKAGDENVGVGLLTYPVLMASDILLYQSDLVPVGEDQKQHLELTRELAERINHLYGGRKWKKLGGRGGSIFKVPEPLIPPTGARVMSLTDGLSKMSKSATSDQSRINLLDSKDAIANKIKRCKTDSFPGLEFDNGDRPECNNLLSIYQIITNRTKEEVAQECHDMNWGTFKPVLTDALIDHLHPIQTRYEEIMSDRGYLDEVLAEGASKAAEIADSTLSNVYQAMGFLKR